MSKHDELITILTPEGEITANKSLLNFVAIAFYALNEKNENEGSNASARYVLSFAETIHDSLKETGYYDDIM